MKIFNFYNYVAVLWLLITFISCEPFPPLIKTNPNPQPSFPSDILPEETQSGQQRLGCLINGKVFTNVETYRLKADHNHYPPSPEEYRIYVIAPDRSKLYLTIYPPFILEDTLKNATIYFVDIPDKNGASYTFDDNEHVKVYLTHHDDKNRILSGKFESTAQLLDRYYHPLDSFIYITDGRFDVEY